MAVKTLSVWDGVPDADTLKHALAQARDRQNPLQERQRAISYLTGAVKVIAKLEKRQSLADYLTRQLHTIKASLYAPTETSHG